MNVKSSGPDHIQMPEGYGENTATAIKCVEMHSYGNENKCGMFELKRPREAKSINAQIEQVTSDTKVLL